ncbi:MAG TPA: Holliday junction branch migration protein RuvA [Candidatus Polarisedimenticolaceae bacterium]
MIARLSGRLISCTPDRVVLDVGGVGYDVSIPLSTFYALQERSGAGSTTLHIHTHVREDAILLFGFATEEERRIFTRLLAVSGVGPKMALAVLSGVGVAEFHGAVAAGERARLERIPGIGRKTAERILLELRSAPSTRRNRRGPDPEIGNFPAIPGVRADAVSALVNLGYAPDGAERAVRKACEDLGVEEPSLDILLREALRGLVR